MRLWRARGLTALLLCAVLLFCACGSGGGSSLPPLDAPEADAAPTQDAANEAVVALVANESRYDTAYGQAVWQAVNRFTGEQGLHSAVYKTDDGDAEAAKSTLSLAAGGGAQLVLALGETASLACNQAADDYPDIDFVLLDLPAGAPSPQRAVWVSPDALSIGWVAGYTAVSSGMTDLLCLWDESEDGLPEGRLYALGFILGCQDAARQRTAEDEAVRLRVLGLDGENPEADAATARELLGQRPQLVLSCFEDWSRVSPWLEGLSTLKLFAPLCQEDVPAGRLWALVEQEPGGIVTQLLAAWQDGGLKRGARVPASPASGDVRLMAGLAGGAQEDLDDAATYLATGTRLSALERAGQVQGEVFPALEAVDFPDLHLLMLPRDFAPLDGSGAGSNRPSPTPAPTQAPAAAPVPEDTGAQAAPQPEPVHTAAPTPAPSATPVPGHSSSAAQPTPEPTAAPPPDPTASPEAAP